MVLRILILSPLRNAGSLGGRFRGPRTRVCDESSVPCRTAWQFSGEELALTSLFPCIVDPVVPGVDGAVRW